MDFRDERVCNIPCVKKDCDYYDMYMEQSCAMKDARGGEPGVTWCESYQPKERLQIDESASLQTTNSTKVESVTYRGHDPDCQCEICYTSRTGGNEC
jgi:hypothetical protein